MKLTVRGLIPLLVLGGISMVGCGSKGIATEAAPAASTTSSTAGNQSAPPMSAEAQAQMRAAQQNSAALRASQAGK